MSLPYLQQYFHKVLRLVSNFLTQTNLFIKRKKKKEKRACNSKQSPCDHYAHSPTISLTLSERRRLNSSDSTVERGKRERLSHTHTHTHKQLSASQNPIKKEKISLSLSKALLSKLNFTIHQYPLRFHSSSSLSVENGVCLYREEQH